MKNTVDYIETWPDNPEEYIRNTCEQFGLPQPVSFAPGKIFGSENLVLDATLADGSTYRLAHSPISDQRGAIVNRPRTAAEWRYIHRIRSAAGQAGAMARWANVEREPTVQVRVYAADAEWLRAQGWTIAEAVRRLRGGR